MSCQAVTDSAEADIRHFPRQHRPGAHRQGADHGGSDAYRIERGLWPKDHQADADNPGKRRA